MMQEMENKRLRSDTFSPKKDMFLPKMDMFSPKMDMFSPKERLSTYLNGLFAVIGR